MRLVVVLALTIFGCDHHEPTAVDAAAATAPKPTDDEAREVAAVLRATHPLSCSVEKDGEDWASCHDDAKGFANLRACVSKLLTTAKAAQAKKPAPIAKTACGKKVEGAELAHIDTLVSFFGAELAWLDSSKAWLAPKLATVTLTDACGDEGCEAKGMPDDASPKYAASNYASIQEAANECTGRLFGCEGVPGANLVGGGCPLYKTVALLGVACDPSENSASSLTARSTGAKVN